MSSSLIKIARDGKDIGEYSLAALGRVLRGKSILLSDHYWRTGMTDWGRVDEIAAAAEDALTEELVKNGGSATQSLREKLNPNWATSSPLARLYLTLSAPALLYALISIAYAMDFAPRLSAKAMTFRSHDGANYLQFSALVASYMHNLGEPGLHIFTCWVLAGLLYLVVMGKSQTPDRKSLQLGTAGFLLAFILWLFTYSLTFNQPGIETAVRINQLHR
jgi:hypothetical protein